MLYRTAIVVAVIVSLLFLLFGAELYEYWMSCLPSGPVEAWPMETAESVAKQRLERSTGLCYLAWTFFGIGAVAATRRRNMRNGWEIAAILAMLTLFVSSTEAHAGYVNMVHEEILSAAKMGCGVPSLDLMEYQAYLIWQAAAFAMACGVAGLRELKR